ncbi:hypothetical protein HDG38_000396 [Paraburkholderia sp. WSM4177]|nr:hypothetical protein [Paraburkholderia sp. WSM4177]MBB5482203.1 hypothetical protein [Paraburkholderia sp. WSM4180]
MLAVRKAVTPSRLQPWSGSPDAIAAIYRLVGTAKLNRIVPEAHLRFVLARIADHAINRIDELALWVIADRRHTAV